MAPAESETFRPHWTRIITLTLAPLAVLAFAALSIGLSVIRWSSWHAWDIVWMNAIGLIIAAVLVKLGSVRATVSSTGLTVHNLGRTQFVEWAQIVSLSYHPRTPEQYALLDLSDGTTLRVKAIQAADGRRAILACERLRRLIDSHTGPHR